MTRLHRHFAGALCAALLLPTAAAAQFTLEQVRSYPFPTELAAAREAPRLAWAMDEQGVRNIYVAEAPHWQARRLTSYAADDGQVLTRVQLSPDGSWVVYRRGGDDANWGADDWGLAAVNPASLPVQPRIQLWAVPFEGGEPRLLAEGGDAPVITPAGDAVLFERGRQLWRVSIDGAGEARMLFFARGSNGGAQFSPDGSRLAFVSNRGDHAFIGIFRDSITPIQWIAPGTSRDGSPRWSGDGQRIAFVRRPGSGGPPQPILERRHQPWSIWIADAATSEARERWRAPATLRGSAPGTHGGTNLHWAAGDRIVFLSYADGWPHLYSMPAAGSAAPLLLTPGEYMAEHIRLSPDGSALFFAANAGSTPGDIDRRHIVRVPVDRAAPEVLTPGTGLEWSPVPLSNGALAFLSATTTRPPLPAVRSTPAGATRLLAQERIPDDFPQDALVTPRSVQLRASDGRIVYAQVFERPGGAASKPAVVFIHGGPQRQMLAGWHYSDYYANAYALQQYFAARGYVALSVNYRLGIGYGFDFHQPDSAGARGASEYRDIVAAAEYLRALPHVDARRIGVWGGSYGGYLAALALARDSDLFAAGVDIHGVHNFADRYSAPGTRFEAVPDREEAAALAWRSSPVAHLDTWRSPVLLIHGDDDRNVRFAETVDLARRLELAGVPFEELIVPDDTHHFLRHANWLRVGRATADFLDRHLRVPPSSR